MLSILRDLAERLRRFDKEVRAVKSNQVSQKGIKQEARDIVDGYFRETREQFIVGGLNLDQLSEFDAGMQHLLEIAQKNSIVQTYRSHIKILAREIRTIEKQVLTVGADSLKRELEPVDKLIIETLSRLLPSSARSYEQAIRDLGLRDRLSWRGPATDFRESLREILDHLAEVRHDAG
jgi:hypothetical protein